MRGMIYADEFRAGEHVTIGTKVRKVVRSPAGGNGFLPVEAVGAEANGRDSAGPLATGVGGVFVMRPGSDVVERPWRYDVVRVLDLETTGTDPATDRIVEIAIVTMRFGQVIDAWSRLVNPGVPIPAEATAVHGITDDMVQHAPVIGQLRDELVERLDVSGSRTGPLLGYHICGFDEPLLMRECPWLVLPPVIDVLPLLREHGRSAVDGMPASKWKSEAERMTDAEREARFGDEDEPVGLVQYKRRGRHTLDRASRELLQADPEVGMQSTLHRAAWDAVLCGRIGWSLRGWCQGTPEEESQALRALAERQQKSNDAFMAKMRQKDAERRAGRPSLDHRIEAHVNALRDLLREQESFRAWQAGAKQP